MRSLGAELDRALLAELGDGARSTAERYGSDGARPTGSGTDEKRGRTLKHPETWLARNRDRASRVLEDASVGGAAVW
jgi:hypothetical protein